ncbi:DUF421 domain-containing protein [Ammoniphilus resinae]|uniref:Uncharacterized membrane protein YcaP (DUF421 family) n=1 Tax=Ammoniphilus resinae TaxID=861532 RepID=A0ABS4GSD6_9BACL|nr:DUF421 domain-containing protein [Ammoniphilus resinae]MBP1933144.1 uncharacterized membrane protein YcaP (DUF421 family) [Ammoniphilus resinae]
MMEESIVVFVRAVITFMTLLIYTRILGKQQMGNLSYFDYINGIVIGSIGGTAATDLSSTAWVHWVGLTTFVGLTFTFQYVTLKNRFLSKMIDAEPTVVVQDGKILEHNLSKMKIKYDELTMLLRQKNIFDITQVAYAVMEPTGSLSVLPKAQYQPATPQDLQITVSPAKMMTEVIIDGLLIEQNLQQRKKDREWLKLQLQAQGIGDVKEVAFAAILPNEQLYVDRFEDHIKKESDMSDYKGPF